MILESFNYSIHFYYIFFQSTFSFLMIPVHLLQLQHDWSLHIVNKASIPSKWNVSLVCHGIPSVNAWCHISQKLQNRALVIADLWHVPDGCFGNFFGGVVVRPKSRSTYSFHLPSHHLMGDNDLWMWIDASCVLKRGRMPLISRPASRVSP